MQSRHTALGIARVSLALVAALALSACGAAGDPGSDGETRVVDTVRGEVEIPEVVERVAVVDWQLPPALLDLGVTPAAIYDGYYEGDVAAARNVPQRYVEALADVPRIGTMDALSLESVAAAEPDVILTLGVGLEDETIDELDTIAPVLHLDSAGGWLEVQRDIADILDAADDFDALLADYEQTAAEVHAEHEDVIGGTTWASVSAGADSGTWFVEGGATPTGTLLHALGIQHADIVDPEGYWGDGRSLETLPDLSSTDVILALSTPDGEPIPGMVPVLESPLFQDLPAATHDNVFPWTSSAASCLGWATDALGELDDILAQVTVS